MIILPAYFRILRPINVILTVFGVVLGSWLTYSHRPIFPLVLLLLAAIGAVGFGNVVNDIKDSESDRINHPDRPIPKGEISSSQAGYFAFGLAFFSLGCAYFVSFEHFIGTLIPLAALTIYTLFLKGTPLVGNILVSILVAYPIIFGGINSAQVHILIIPAAMAFFLNLCREIIKDMQDRKGDLTYGIKTTAIIPANILRIILLGISLVNLSIFFLPYLYNHFHLVYLFICICIIVPIHLFWLFLFLVRFSQNQLERISVLLKIEMLSGLIALAADKFFPLNIPI